MTVRVDYGCERCGRVEEFARRAPSVTRTCSACGGTAKRRWTTFGIGRVRSGDSAVASDGPTPAPPSAGSGKLGPDLCRSNSGVPGLCLLGESAGRALVARAKGDGRALEREQQRQTEVLVRSGHHEAVMSDHAHSHGGGAGKTTSPGPREIT